MTKRLSGGSQTHTGINHLNEGIARISSGRSTTRRGRVNVWSPENIHVSSSVVCLAHLRPRLCASALSFCSGAEGVVNSNGPHVCVRLTSVYQTTLESEQTSALAVSFSHSLSRSPGMHSFKPNPVHSPRMIMLAEAFLPGEIISENKSKSNLFKGQVLC